MSSVLQNPNLVSLLLCSQQEKSKLDWGFPSHGLSFPLRYCVV